MAGARVESNLESGYFTKPSSIYTGDPYEKKKQKPKGKALGPPIRSSKGGELFSDKPPRIFQGEAYFDAVKHRHKQERKARQKQLTYKFTPSGAGTDTFSGPISALDPRSKDKAKKGKGKEPRNFYTAPGRQGTGYGYADVTLGKLPFLPVEYDSESRARRKDAKAAKAKVKGPAFRTVSKGAEVFDANPFQPVAPKGRKPKQTKPKKVEVPFRPTGSTRRAVPGATSHMDNFSTFTYKSEPYAKKKEKPKGKPVGPAFRPCAPSKSSYVKSVVATNVARSVRPK
jgi:hypothetical protein